MYYLHIPMEKIEAMPDHEWISAWKGLQWIRSEEEKANRI